MEDKSPFGKQTNPLIFEICLGVGIVIMLSILFWFVVSGVYKQHEIALEEEKAEKVIKAIETKLKEEEERARFQMKIEMERNAIRAAQSEGAWNAYRQAQAEAREAQANNNFIQFRKETGENETARGEVITPARNIIIGKQTALKSPEEKRAEECESWKSSNVLEPTPEKRRKIIELCEG